MAKIVLGMGASHGPLLATPPEQWGGRVEADRRNPALVYRDGTFKFEELAKLRAKENLEQQIELPVKQKRYDACQRAMAEMARRFKEAQAGRRHPGRQRPDGGVRGRQYPDLPGVLRRDPREHSVLGGAEEAIAARHRDRRAEPSRQDRARPIRAIPSSAAT